MLEKRHIVLVTQELVVEELNKNRRAIEHQLAVELEDVSLKLDVYHACLALKYHPLSESYISKLKNELFCLLDEILTYSQILEKDDSCNLKGLYRTTNCKSPAKKGKSPADSCIYEHFLELAFQCRKHNFDGSITFFSSNTKDYGRRSDNLIQEDEIRLDFTYFSHIAGALKHTTNNLSVD